MRASLCLSALLLSGWVSAACDVRPMGEEQGFPSMRAALDRAHSLVGDASVRTDTEYVGVIARRQDGYAISFFRGCAGEDSFELRVPPTQRVVAIWHTHGRPGLFRDRFSHEDAALVRTLRVPMILLLPDGDARVLRVREASRPSRRSLARAVGYEGRPLPAR